MFNESNANLVKKKKKPFRNEGKKRTITDQKRKESVISRSTLSKILRDRFARRKVLCL